MAIIDRRTGQVVRLSRPLPGVDKLFTLPKPGTHLWKYGDFRKFEQLFTDQTLYFRRADQLPDLYEGKFTQGNVTRRSGMFTDAFADLKLGDPKVIQTIQESHRSRTFLNCWHKNERESPRMWKEYTSTADAVVLMTTPEAIIGAIPDQCRGAEVHYVDESEPLPELHSLAALAHKRQNPYAFEDEFRLIYQLSPHEEIFLDQPKDYFRNVPVDTAKLVHEIRFHPEASSEFKEKVRVLLATKGWVMPVCNSEFAKASK